MIHLKSLIKVPACIKLWQILVIYFYREKVGILGESTGHDKTSNANNTSKTVSLNTIIILIIKLFD